MKEKVSTKHRLLSLMLCLALIATLFVGTISVSAETILYTETQAESVLGITDASTLDLWLEADANFTSDGETAATWTSLVNRVGASAPAMLQATNAETSPVQVINGTRKTLYFTDDIMASEVYDKYHGPMTVFLVTAAKSVTTETYPISTASSRMVRYMRNKSTASAVSYTVQSVANNEAGESKTTGFSGSNSSNVATLGKPAIMHVYFNSSGTAATGNIASGETGYAQGLYGWSYINNQTYNGMKKFGANSDTRPGYDTIDQYTTKGADDEISAILVFKTDLSADECTKVYNYLNNKYLLPAPTAAKMNSAGTTLTLSLDGVLTEAPAATDFSVSVGGTAVTPTAAALDANDSTKVVLNLGTAVAWGQTVTVTYSGSAIQSFANRNVDVSAIPEPGAVTNEITAAQLNAAGTQITLTVSEDLTEAPAKEDFTLTVAGSEAAVSNVALDGARNVVLTLARAVAYNQAVSLSYSGALLKGVTDYVADVSLIPNPNAVDPAITAAYLGVYGDNILVKFNVPVTTAEGLNKESFAVTAADGSALPVASVSEKLHADDVKTSWTEAYITLSTPAAYNEMVKLSYNGTEIYNAIDNSRVLAAVTDFLVTPYSITEAGIPKEGLDLWVEADDAENITTDADGNVTAWESKVNGVGMETPVKLALSSTTGNGYLKPVLKTDANGVKSIYFHGIELDSNAADGVKTQAHQGDYTIFLVFKQGTNLTLGANPYFFKTGDDTLGGMTIYRNNTPTYQLRSRDTEQSTSSYKNYRVGSPNTDNYSIFVIRGAEYDALNENRGVEIWQDGVVQTGHTKNNPGYNLITGYTFGNKFDGDVNGIMAYKRALSDAEIDATYQYLYEKYVMPKAGSVQYDLTTTVADGKATITGTITNTSVLNPTDTATAILGSYTTDADGNRMLRDASMNKLTNLNLWTPMDINAEIEYADGMDIKAHLWHNLTDLAPLTNVLTIEIPAELAE